MGSLDGIEAGLRQMRRTRPLETTVVDLGGGLTVGRAATLPLPSWRRSMSTTTTDPMPLVRY
ncbi:MAG: hypothetical protein IPH38_18740 [Candidatus Microthrix sp.]|nr:hypothetical protein [Candidatus Microthrix sp.]MBK7021567.1 hypothetical protein [Candidatus Microthrix sp.]